MRTEATSPSTIAASIGPCTIAAACAANCAAPASPPEPPLVDTSTIGRCVSREANTRASSSSAAVPDSCATEPEAAASRWAMITIGLAPVAPGRCAITVSSVRSPSIVCARTCVTRTRKPPLAVPPSPSIVCATCCARRWSPELPGRLFGNSAASWRSSPYAWLPANASGASVEVSGPGRGVSENATTTSTIRNGANEARYRRPLSIFRTRQ